MSNKNNISNLEEEINLLSYLRVLRKHKWLVGLIVGIGLVISIVVSLRLPKIYASTASIFPPQHGGSSKSFMSLEGLSGFLNVKSPADLWVGMLKSQTIKDAVVKRFNLINRFKVENLEDARKVLTGMTKLEKSGEGIIFITVESKDPKLSADLANAFVEELDQLNRRIVMTSGKRTRVFVEKRLEEVKTELEKLEETAKRFQVSNKAIMLDAQSKAVMGAISSIKNQLMSSEVELQTMLSYATPDNPQVEMLTTRMEELKKRLSELEDGKNEGPNPDQEDLFIPAGRFPDITLQYARLLRNVKTQQNVYELLTEQYEMARIQEAKDTPTVQILDRAKIPERGLESKWKQVVFLYVTIATFIAISLAFFIEYIEKVKKQRG